MGFIATALGRDLKDCAVYAREGVTGEPIEHWLCHHPGRRYRCRPRDGFRDLEAATEKSVVRHQRALELPQYGGPKV